MSIVSITSFACTAAYLCDNGGGRRRYVRCVDFWRVLMLFGGHFQMTETILSFKTNVLNYQEMS
jgi:hypothetical protein